MGPQQATNHEATKALHALLFCRTGKQQGKASAAIANIARSKASKSQPASKHDRNKQQTMRLLKHCMPCCFAGTENFKAKLVQSKRPLPDAKLAKASPPPSMTATNNKP